MHPYKGRDRVQAERDRLLYRAADRDDRPCRDQIVIEGIVTTALVNAAYRVIAFTGSAPQSDRERTLHWITGQNLPSLTQGDS
ncbi:hypothetical protein Taro_030507 [Colocasia esculenta]|uniref:Uncharacterized protein n=1 Tax=Colocasia esculenta TaxID=4460 RepID=A0A843W3J2_COLES|nr:hypothetical protein [Colocasia esculenta]